MFSIQELRSSTEKELDQELSRARKELLKIRISVRNKHEKDTSKVKKINCYIAQILTVMKETKEEVLSDSAPDSAEAASDEKATAEPEKKSKKTS